MKSRIIVKNISKNVNENILRNFFTQHLACSVTDLSLYPDRGFAFVGFTNEDYAEKALKLNGTRLKNTPLKIEECLEIKDQTNKRMKTKAKAKKNDLKSVDKAKDSKIDAEKKTNQDISANLGSFLLSKVDPNLEEEDEDDSLIKQNMPKNNSKKSLRKSNRAVYAVLIKGMEPSTKPKDIKEFLQPIPCDFIQIKKNGSAVVFFSSDKHRQDALKRNRGFIGKKRVSVRQHNAAIQPQEEDNSTTVNPKRVFIPSKSEEEIIEELQDTGRLFVRNLAFNCQEEDLIKLFSPYGKLTEINVAYDNRLQQNKGFAFVSFMFPEHAIKAFRDLDKTIFMGRNLHIIPAKPRPDDDASNDEEEDDKDGKSSNFRDKKAKQLKSTASLSYNWNTLFVSPEAVASVMAEQQGVSKEEFVSSKDKTGAAVRLALGETKLVLETKQFLESQGVHLEAFESAVPTLVRKIRAKTGEIKQEHLSLTTFLAKNLPVGITKEELSEIFGKFDGLKRCIVPPYGLTAIIEYSKPQQAKAAYKSLAYFKLQEKILLLEWAPLNLISEEKSESQSDLPQHEKENETKAGKKNKRKRKVSNTEEFDNSNIADSSLTDSATLPIDKKKKCIEESSSEKPADSIPVKKEQPQSNILIIKNIAFQASKKEIEKLFSPFGNIIGIRLPKKPNGDHRGFAFIEYSSVEEAKKTMESFGLSTHFYGRRLVIEYSSSEKSS